MWNKIYDRNSQKYINLYTDKGIKLLNEYITQNGGSSKTTKFELLTNLLDYYFVDPMNNEDAQIYEDHEYDTEAEIIRFIKRFVKEGKKSKNCRKAALISLKAWGESERYIDDYLDDYLELFSPIFENLKTKLPMSEVIKSAIEIEFEEVDDDDDIESILEENEDFFNMLKVILHFSKYIKIDSRVHPQIKLILRKKRVIPGEIKFSIGDDSRRKWGMFSEFGNEAVQNVFDKLKGRKPSEKKLIEELNKVSLEFPEASDTAVVENVGLALGIW